jgi:type IV pilus assembly protein PilE
MKRSRGFTLIELMIAVLIVGILAAVAYPSYRAYVIRGNRTAAEAVMMDINTVQQQYFLANRSYGTVAQLGYTLPSDVSPNYALSITLGSTLDGDCAVVASGIPSYVITMTAQAGQTGDGNLLLSNEGRKCPVDKWK